MKILNQPKIKWAYIWATLFGVSLSVIAGLVFVLKVQEVKHDQDLNRVLKETEKKHRGKNILIVGHGDPLWLLNGVMKGLSQKELLDILRIKKEYIQKGEWRRI